MEVIQHSRFILVRQVHIAQSLYPTSVCGTVVHSFIRSS